jgi:hypothetical protein
MSNVIIPRTSLAPFVGKQANCSGRIKEIRRHPERRDLDNVLLVNVIVTPDGQESLLFDHLWVLKKQLRSAKIETTPGKRVIFRAKIYKYRRLGGKSSSRGILGNSDYGLMPINK